jgi:signal recognition particle subunit SRP54
VFDALSEKLQATLADVRGHGTLTEDDIKNAMREIRLALLEADVNFKVVKEFTNTVRERCMGADIIGQLNPGQQVVKIVHEELEALMGGASASVSFSPRPPTVILMAGLQGSGKTTATAKLAKFLMKEHGSSVALAACDVYRPAAVDQLVKVGGQVGAEVYEQGTDRDPVDIARWALDRAKQDGKDVLIVDTSGRLHVDERLMQELKDLRKAVRPTDILLVVDADKTGYPAYLDAILPKLAPHGLIVADNMLRDGAVLDADPDEGTRAIAAYNARAAADPSLSAVLLTVRDGLSLVTRA